MSEAPQPPSAGKPVTLLGHLSPIFLPPTPHLGVNRDTIYRALTRKIMPAHKLGRLWKFLASEVDAWVKAGKAAQTKA